MVESALDSLSPLLRAAYSPELLQQCGSALLDRFTTHLTQLQQRQSAVLNWNEPKSNRAAAQATLNTWQQFGHGTAVDAQPGMTQPALNHSELLQSFEHLLETALQRGHNLHHPRYIGHQVPAAVPLAGLFDAIVALTNQVMAIYEMGPWATAVERELVDAWGTRFGLAPDSFTGFVTHGGSLANLTALLTARNVSLENSWKAGVCNSVKGSSTKLPVLVAQQDSHYCVTRSAGILGLGSRQVLKAPLDSQRRMDAQRLADLLATLRREGTPIVAVAAAACATPIGAFDPLDEIASICEQHDVWLHVDAAHGGAVSFSRQHRHLLAGIERANSFIADAHKTLFVPALCAFVFYREKAHRFATFEQDAPYLFDPSAPGMADVDSGMATIECTKRAASFGLWGIWSLFGPGLFEELIDHTFARTRQFYEKLSAASDFVPLHEPQCNIQVFRYLPPGESGLTSAEVGELNRQIRRRLMESGEFYLVQTNLDGVGALRVCVMNPLTTEDDLDHLLQAIRRTARELQTHSQRTV